MSTPSIGDRVRVEFEGEITAVWDKSCDIKFPEGPNGEYVPEAEYVPLTAVTVLEQPVKVGDVIPQDKLHHAGRAGLRVGSVVIGTGSRERHFLSRNGWHAASPTAIPLSQTGGVYEVEFIPEVAA